MKLLRCLSLCLLAHFALLGRMPAADTESAYQQAVNAYVDAAGNELRALRLQAEEAAKAAPVEKQEAYKVFFAKLEQCETTHKQLKGAAAKDFDRTKALYEQQRQDAVQAWAKIASR